MSGIEPWNALALQTRCDAINHLQDPQACRDHMLAGIARIGAQIAASKAFIGPQVRLVVLPEYFLTSFPMGESITAWRDKACIAVDGPEYAALGELCRKHQVFLSEGRRRLESPADVVEEVFRPRQRAKRHALLFPRQVGSQRQHSAGNRPGAL